MQLPKSELTNVSHVKLPHKEQIKLVTQMQLPHSYEMKLVYYVNAVT